MSARPARATLGTDEEEGIVAETTVLVSPFLAKAFGLDESFAAPSDRTAGNSSGDASGSLGSGAGGRGGGALRHSSPLGIEPAPRGLLGGAGDAPDASELRATLVGAAGDLARFEPPAAGGRADAYGEAMPPPAGDYHAKRVRFSGEDDAAALLAAGGGGSGEDGLGGKRPRLVWTPQLHKRFVDAVSHLGIKCAVPKTIMQLMNVEGLTRENVASHLQKYRLYLKRLQCSSAGAGALAAAAAAAGMAGLEDGGDGDGDGAPQPPTNSD